MSKKCMSKLVELTEEQIKLLEDKGETLSEVKDLDGLIGQKWFIRTVTYFIVGRITKRIGNFFLLEEASWVADTGRFMQCIANGTLNEVEPVGPALVNTSSITDMFPWNHKLPTDQK